MSKSLHPGLNLFTESCDIDALESRRIWIEPPRRRAQQGCRPNRIVSLQMMKRRRDLNERLQEGLHRLIASQPNDLPMFMRQKEFLIPVASQTLGKLAATPVKIHAQIEYADRM